MLQVLGLDTLKPYVEGVGILRYPGLKDGCSGERALAMGPTAIGPYGLKLRVLGNVGIRVFGYQGVRACGIRV